MKRTFMGVNALNGLLSFLPTKKSCSFAGASVCVNALNGLLSFLLRKEDLKMGLVKKCQRPKRAFIISTEHKFTLAPP